MAELLVGYGRVEQAIAMLKEVLVHRPDYIDVRVKLKDIYLRSEMMEKASSECFEIARIYEARGDTARARDYTVRAERLAQSFKDSGSLTQTSAPEAIKPEAIKKEVIKKEVIKKDELQTSIPKSATKNLKRRSSNRLESTGQQAPQKAATIVSASRQQQRS